MKKFLQFLGLISLMIGVFLFVMVGIGFFGLMKGGQKTHLSDDVVLLMELEGVILDGKKFLKDLRKYAYEPKVKAVVVRINSPGGVVGPSQEIYSELKRIKDELGKPIIASCSGVAASGAYYAAMGASQIVTNPGTLMGSIGVIMEFVNLEKLYEWAKIKRYSLTSGKFKDAGSDYKPMTVEERQLMQQTMDEVWSQFKQAVAEGRDLEPRTVEEYADGRIFTGAKAVELGFADKIGTLTDAIRIAGDLSGLGEDPKIFRPKRFDEDFWEILLDDRLSGIAGYIRGGQVSMEMQYLKLLGKPLYIMPGAIFGQ